jgi:hypothetical protein
LQRSAGNKNHIADNVRYRFCRCRAERSGTMKNLIDIIEAEKAKTAINLTTQDFSDFSDAVIAAQKAAGFIKFHTEVILAAIAEAEGRCEQFKTYAARLGKRLNTRFDSFIADTAEFKRRNASHAQRWRRHYTEGLLPEQARTQFFFVEYESGSTTKENHRQSSKLKVDVEIFREIVENARRNEKYQTNRAGAFEHAAKEALNRKAKRNLILLPPTKISEAEKLARIEKTLSNTSKSFVKFHLKNGLTPDEIADFLPAIVKNVVNSFQSALIEAGAVGCQIETPQTEVSSENLTKPDILGFQFDTPQTEGEPDFSEYETDTVLLNRVSTSPSTEPPRVFLESNDSEPFRNTRGADEAADAIKAFESVGATSFDVTMRNEATDEKEIYEQSVTGDRLRAGKLLEYLARNEAAPESFIMRPRGARLIQIDDADARTLERLKPFAFLTVETSHENFQAWLALSPQTTEPELKQIRARLLEHLQPSGANGGAYGAVRWSGSINHKPERNGFRVRINSSQMENLIDAAQLEAAALLAEPKPERAPVIVPTVNKSNKIIFPNYERCLSDKSGDRSRADASFMRICSMRGISETEATDELKRVSERAANEEKRGRTDYIRRTADFAYGS